MATIVQPPVQSWEPAVQPPAQSWEPAAVSPVAGNPPAASQTWGNTAPLALVAFAVSAVSAPMISQLVQTIRGPNAGTGTSSGHGSALARRARAGAAGGAS